MVHPRCRLLQHVALRRRKLSIQLFLRWQMPSADRARRLRCRRDGHVMAFMVAAATALLHLRLKGSGVG